VLSAVVLLRQEVALAEPDSSPHADHPAASGGIGAATGGGTVLPRIDCTGGYTASVYAAGLVAPDGLAFDPNGVLYVAEEMAGRISQVGAGGSITPVITGLTNPEGIAFDDAGSLYIVEDAQAGRLIKRTSDSLTTTLAADLDAPEGVVWTPDGTLYVTESNAEFVTDLTALQTRIASVSPSGAVSRIITNTPTIDGADVAFWSYAGITVGPDGSLYVTNELAGVERSYVVVPGFTLTLHITDSVFTVDPSAGARRPFASGLASPEGLRFSADDGFPLYVAEEDIGGGAGRLSRVGPDGSHSPLCTGFFSIEDVAVDQSGWLYVSEDTSGLVIRIRPSEPVEPGDHRVWLPLVLRQG